MNSENLGVLVTFVFYLVLLIVIGRMGEKKHSGSYKDFVSADKSLGGLVTAISSASSSESVWVMLGLSGLGYWKGAAALWAAAGCVAGFVFNALFVVRQLRRESERLGTVTVSDYVAARVGDHKGLLRLISAVVITFFMLTYVVAQFNGAGDLFQVMELLGPETPYWLGVVVGAFIIGLYIVLGGYAAVCWTDTVQGVLMFVVMLGLPILAVVKAGGPGGIAEALGPTGLLSITGPEGFGWAAMGFIVGWFGIALGYPGMPHMIVRYMTVRDDTEARKAAWISIVWAAVVLFGSTTLGIAVHALAPELAATQKEAEQMVIPYFCRLALPPLLTGVVLSAVTAAIMSTADSQLMYAATSLINDLWLKRRGAQPVPAAVLVRWTRVVLVLMTIIAAGVALMKVRLIFTFVLFAWGALGAAFSPIILLGLYWPRLNRWGALASLIYGPVVVIIWHLHPVLDGMIYALIPAFAVSFFGAILMSLLTGGTEGASPPPGQPVSRSG